MNTKRIRMITDIAMVILIPMLMAYSLIGETFHEIAGTVMFALFIAHHILNRSWFKTLFKGRYSAKRIFQTVLDLLLLVFMIMQPVSGILMSRYLFTFIHIQGITAQARSIHMLFAYWGFILMCLHAGTHLTVPLGKLRRHKKELWTGTIGILSVISIYGIYAMFKRSLIDYMFMRTPFVFFDTEELKVFFFADYIAIMVLFFFIGYLIVSGLTKAGSFTE